MPASMLHVQAWRAIGSPGKDMLAAGVVSFGSYVAYEELHPPVAAKKPEAAPSVGASTDPQMRSIYMEERIPERKQRFAEAGFIHGRLGEVEGIFPNKKIANKMNEMMQPPLVSQLHVAATCTINVITRTLAAGVLEANPLMMQPVPPDGKKQQPA